MICKKDVLQWFKELESYKRIDTMCALLNMCLPFELRFLGTCLEELGRRDSQELRGMELRVNNPQDLATDVVACQKGEPTDKKIRRKMALYLALIRACNRTCVSEIFRTLEGWGERDFLGMNEMDTLQELLLVYTMAAHHPVFSFDQHMKCTDIFEKIKENKLLCDQPMQYAVDNSVYYGQQQQQQMQQQTQMSQQELRQAMPMTHQDMLQQQQHALHAMHLSGQHPHTQMQGPPPTMQVLPPGTMPINFQQGHMTKLIPSDSSLQHQLTVDGLHVVTPNITIPTDPNNIMRHPDATWALRPYPPPQLDQPPPVPSPIISQHSSPSSSRAASPNRPLQNTGSGGVMQQGMQMTQQQQRRMGGGGSMKNIRRPSVETTPPPMATQQQQQQQPQQQMLSNDIILPQNLKHEDVVLTSDGSGQQLQSLIRNGYTRSGHQRLKTGIYVPVQQQQQTSVNQQQQQQHFQTFPPGTYAINSSGGLSYSMQGMSLGDPLLSHHMDGGMSSLSSNKSNGSDSGSPLGSCAEVSPPETPTLMTNSALSNTGNLRMSQSDHQPQQQQQQQQQKMHHQQMGGGYSKQMGRMNGGRSDKMVSGGVSNAASNIVYAQAATHQQQTQQLFGGGGSTGGGDIILTTGGNAGGGANIMQTSLTGGGNNNNVSGGNNSNLVAGGGNNMTNSSSNNNIAGNAASAATVLISSAAPAGSVISTNSVILQPHQQQYSTSYPYHIATTNRPPPLMTHNPAMAPPPPASFRLPSFQIPPPNDLLYPYHHPLTFLSGAAPVGMRTSSSGGGGVVNAATPTAQQPAVAALPTAPYSPLTTIQTNKPPPPVSCYNCGSQAHCGRDCQEASMDDVTRNAIYKLDYSVAASSNVSPTATAPGGGGGGSGGSSSSSTSSGVGVGPVSEQMHQKEGNTNQSSASATTTTATSSGPPSSTAPTPSVAVSGQPVNTK